MADTKKYYWLKLKNDFFTSKEMKKLRKIAGGDTYTIIYLKLQLLSLQDAGVLYFDGIEDSLAEELSLVIDEEPDNIQATLLFLNKCGLIETRNEHEILLTAVPEVIGKEGASAERMRRLRERQNKTKNKTKALQSDANASQSDSHVTKSDTEIDIDIDIDIEKDIEKEKEKKSASAPVRHKYGEYKNVLLTDQDVEKLKTEYPGSWTVRIESLSAYMKSTGKSYKDHLATIRNWARRDAEKEKQKKTTGNKAAEELSESYEMITRWAEE